MSYRESARPMRPGRRAKPCSVCRGTGLFRYSLPPWLPGGPFAGACWACDGRTVVEGEPLALDRARDVVGAAAARIVLGACRVWVRTARGLAWLEGRLGG